MCLCQEQSESWPKDSLSSWERQISALKWGWPRLSPISPSHEEHWRAHYSVHQHKQVTSSHNSTLWLYSTLTKVVVILIHHRLFKERPGWVKLGFRYIFLRGLPKSTTIYNFTGLYWTNTLHATKDVTMSKHWWKIRKQLVFYILVQNVTVPVCSIWRL